MLKNGIDYNWVDYTKGPSWEGNEFRDRRNVSRDGGKTWSD